ncbi:ABC transporter substrate-binding protein [Vallicoccus soli]|uniref:ABC transporter substrate-binding protein n=1 Tax=Vallicoccus soli TaxID=2339232 RepID=A0A3A3Z6L5_9ACTN|nr:ABC transporter substrate-binding protein [Vallicoccus soli]RJK97567.1 ABC transporter substrate-binding protein [Vallicoccus soli]
MLRTTLRSRGAAALAAAVAVGLAGCGSSSSSAGSGSGCEPADEVTIAYQPGLGYASLLLAKQEGTLEEALPDVDVSWRQLDSGAAIRDGMIAGDVQVGAGGIGPFLVGVDGGVDWQVVTGLNEMSLQLMVQDPAIRTLEDLRGAGSIAVPAPDSIQAVVLRRGAQEELGDAAALNSQVVAMGHPDGVQALVAGQVAGHLTAPPFQEQEEAAGARALLSSYDLFGRHTFNSAYTMRDFAACNPEVVDALVSTVREANERLTDQPEEAARTLAAETGQTAQELLAQITAEDVGWTTKPTGFGTFAEFMQSIGMIREVPATDDLFLNNQATQGAS